MERRNVGRSDQDVTQGGEPGEGFAGKLADGRSHITETLRPVFGPPPFIVETVFFGKIGHTFAPVPQLPGFPQQYAVQDFILDQTGVSGCDGKVEATKDFDLTTTTLYRFNVYPRDRAKRIKVVPPAAADVFVGLDTGRRFVNAAGDVFDMYSPITFFQYLVGTPPVLTYNAFRIGHNTNHWVEFFIQARTTSAFLFLGFVTIGTYPTRTFDPGLKSYQPYSNSVPFGLPSQEPVPYLVFSYLTESSVDPGPFVFLT